MQTTRDKLEMAKREVAELQKVLAAEERDEKAKRQEKYRELAVLAHRLLCQYNHTDGCGWGYEESAEDPWGGYAHARWLDKVEDIITGSGKRGVGVTEDEFRAVLEGLDTLKQENPKMLVVMDALRRL